MRHEAGEEAIFTRGLLLREKTPREKTKLDLRVEEGESERDKEGL